MLSSPIEDFSRAIVGRQTCFSHSHTPVKYLFLDLDINDPCLNLSRPASKVNSETEAYGISL